VITRNEQVSGSSPLLGSLYSLRWRYDIEAEKPRNTTFGEGRDLEHDDLASMHNCIHTEVRFRALLTEDGDPRVQLHSS
jgi:hypothetical protein